MATDPDQAMNQAREAIAAGDFDTLRKRSIDLTELVRAQRRELAIQQLTLGSVLATGSVTDASFERALDDVRQVAADAEIYLDKQPHVWVQWANEGIIEELAADIEEVRAEHPHPHYEEVRDSLPPGGYWDPEAPWREDIELDSAAYREFRYETGRTGNFPETEEFAEFHETWAEIEQTRATHIAASQHYDKLVTDYEIARHREHLAEMGAVEVDLEPEGQDPELSTSDLVLRANEEVAQMVEDLDTAPNPQPPEVPPPEPGPDLGP